jgi:hypothetical protein
MRVVTVGGDEGRMKPAGGATLRATILAGLCAVSAAHADTFDLKSDAADVSIATEAAAPDGALKASSQVLIRPHLAPELDTRLALTLATGDRADGAPVWAGVNTLPPLSWSRAGIDMQAAWSASPGTKLQVDLNEELRSQVFLGPSSLDSRPMSLDARQTARLNAAAPIMDGVTLALSGGVGADDGAVDLVQGGTLTRRVSLRSDGGDLSSQLDWKVNPALNLQLADKLESRNLTWGDAGVADGYVAVEPRAVAVLKPLPGAEWSLSVEHVASPLDLGKFASLAQTAEQTSTPAAAARLRPDDAWRLKAAISHKLRNTGVLTVAFTRADLLSSTELVRIAPGVQAPGSVAGGQRQQWDVSLNLPLDVLGLNAVSFQSSGLWRRSEITDPITGLPRPPSGETPYEAKIGLVADLPDRNLRLGVLSQASGPSAVYSLSRVDEVQVSPSVGAFVEYRPSSLALRLQLDNLAGADRNYVSTQYAVTRGVGPSEELDRRAAGSPGFHISLRRTL